MSGGGSTTVQSSDPWAGAQPYLRDLYGRAFTNANNPAGYYPGATYLGPTQGQLAGWDAQLAYADQVFGGASAPRFGEATGALSGALTGTNNLGTLSQSLAPFANQRLQQAFSTGAPTFNPTAYTPAQNFNPTQFAGSAAFNPTQFAGSAAFNPTQFAGNASFNPTQFAGNASFNPSAFAPTLTTASGLNTSNAFDRALSGAPDYSSLQGAISAANAPLLRQFQQDILPGLNQRATFLGNPTGGIKTLNRVLPELGERMSQNAATITEAERQRALGAQQQAAQYLTGAGLQASALGQQGAGQAASIALQNQQLGLQGAGQAASIALQNQQLGQQGAAQAANIAQQNQQLGLQGAGQAANIALQNQQLGQQGAAQAANIAQQNQQLGLQGAGQAANITLQNQQLGLQGASAAAGLGLQGYGLGLQGAGQAANLQSDYRNQLLALGNLGANIAGQQSGQALQAASMFPTLVQAGQMPGQLASGFANFGAGFQNQALQDQIARWNYYQNLPAQAAQQYSGLLTGAGGLGGSSTSRTSQGMGVQDWAGIALGIASLASDRRLKTDIERVGTLESGLAVYRYRYKGDATYQLGVMADEVREVFPDAVHVGPGGFERVDYRKVA